MQIDHLVVAGPDLDEAVDDLERRFGVRAAAGGRHVGVGTRNALLALGDGTYLEVIAPDPEQRTPPRPRPFGVDGLMSPTLVGWAIAVDDLDAAVSGARARGYDPGDPVDMQRATPAGTVLHWRLTFNAVDGGPVPFLISWGETPHPAASAPAGLELDSLVVEHPDPARLARTLSALGAELPVSEAPAPALVARICGPHGTVELR